MKNRTLIMATHRGQLLELVDRVIVLDSGRIVADDKKEKFVERSSGKMGNEISKRYILACYWNSFSAIVWINVTEIEAIIRGEGEVSPEANVQLVQPRFSGRIAKIRFSRR